jgi:cytochrome oxidase Cu insertion factor (SCO1/SenC/PrrC family)
MTSRPYLTLPKFLLFILLAILTSCATTTKQTPEISQPAPAKPGSEINQSAPVFTAIDLRGRSFGLSDYRGKNIVLVFYIGHR